MTHVTVSPRERRRQPHPHASDASAFPPLNPPGEPVCLSGVHPKEQTEQGAFAPLRARGDRWPRRMIGLLSPQVVLGLPSREEHGRELPEPTREESRQSPTSRDASLRVSSAPRAEARRDRARRCTGREAPARDDPHAEANLGGDPLPSGAGGKEGMSTRSAPATHACTRKRSPRVRARARLESPRERVRFEGGAASGARENASGGRPGAPAANEGPPPRSWFPPDTMDFRYRAGALSRRA